MTTTAERAAAGTGTFLDERLGVAKAAKTGLRKIFPDHWSFMLGEIALYSFVILLLSGTFLTLWFKPSQNEVVYNGSWAALHGLKMSEAYASTLTISFDVRGGLVIRQIHHWAALIFVASISVHMFRVFFTGAFRKPRELNWVIGVLLSMLAFIEGFAGYSLPDDLLSGTGLRVAEGIMQSVPIVGTYVSYFAFGGAFPGTALVPRLFTVHVLLVPGILLALITAHLFMVVYHKHTQYPGPGRTEKNVVGYPLYPVYMAKAGGFFFVVFGITTLMAAFLTINPIWAYGPYNPSEVTAGSQPDWYVGWLDGALRVMPNWETNLWGHTISWNVMIPGVLLIGIVYTAAALYPFIEAWVTGDKREHHILDRPRNAPTRTALGAMSIVFYGILWASGGNDILAIKFHLAINWITLTFRVLIIVLPPLVYVVTKRICLGLQKHDREKVLHGRESGIIRRMPDGEYIEVHVPVDDEARYALTNFEPHRPVAVGPAVDENGVAARRSLASRARARLSRFYFEDTVEPATPDDLHELEGSHH